MDAWTVAALMVGAFALGMAVMVLIICNKVM